MVIIVEKVWLWLWLWWLRWRWWRKRIWIRCVEARRENAHLKGRVEVVLLLLGLVYDLVVAYDDKARVAQICRVQEVGVVVKEYDAGGGRADEQTVLLGLEQRLVALLEDANGRGGVDVRSLAAQLLLHVAFACAHQIRAELGGVVADRVPAADAVRHAQHVHERLLGDEPRVVAELDALRLVGEQRRRVGRSGRRQRKA